jgi:hypothetical protein
MKLSHVLVGFTIVKMSLTSLGYDECSYKEKLRVSVGPGMYMLGTPGNDDVYPCSQDISVDPYMRYQHWGAGTCAPGSAVDDGSELLGLRYKKSKCSADSYAPGKYAQKPACAPPGKTGANAAPCFRPREDTRLSNPPCTLKGTGWNRWEWLCWNPQDRALIPFEWNTNSSMLSKDNHIPCIEIPLDQEGFSPAVGHTNTPIPIPQMSTAAQMGPTPTFSSCGNMHAL